MVILDNINRLLGDDLKQVIQPGSKLRIAASCFSIYAFEALKDELAKINSLQFIFTSPTFVPGEATDRVKKEHREFHIPKLGNALAACFDTHITEGLVKELAKRKPQRVVFRDSSFESDSIKINVGQIFKLLSPETEVKSL